MIQAPLMANTSRMNTPLGNLETNQRGAQMVAVVAAAPALHRHPQCQVLALAHRWKQIHRLAHRPLAHSLPVGP